MKKFTKILSLALALALVLSTTAFAATTVYYTQDFSSYSTITDLHNVVPDYTVGTNVTNASVAIAQMQSTGFNMFGRTTGQGYFTETGIKPAFSTDASGIKWLTLFTNAEKAGQSGTFVVVPNSTWDYTAEANRNQTYVVSFDLKTAPQGSNGETGQTVNIYPLWTDGGETATDASDSVLDLIRNKESNDDKGEVIYARHRKQGTNWASHTQIDALSDNTAYKMAIGYKYATDDEGVALDYPHRVNAVDGEVIVENTGANGATSTISKLGALMFGYNYYINTSLANIKMYTIGNSDTLDVSRVGTELVPTSNASIEVKFSQPVGKLNKTAVTVNGLTYGEDFTVTDVKDVVTETEVYSTATVNFTALEEATTYTITFPATTTNEIGTAITGNTVSFTTEKAPTYSFAFKAWEGLTEGNDDAQIAADAMAGKTVYFTATATNNTGRATSGALAIGIYDAQDNLVKYAFANKAFATNGAENTFSAAFKLEAGQTAKAFVTGSASEIAYQ